jgi:hypothetical protein
VQDAKIFASTRKPVIAYFFKLLNIFYSNRAQDWLAFFLRYIRGQHKMTINAYALNTKQTRSLL